MARIARAVQPGIPYHITQRGNFRQRIFFDQADVAFYRMLLCRFGEKYGVGIDAYCLMPNHVHVEAVPREADSLAQFMRSTQSAYARYQNERLARRGHLWSDRYYSAPLDVGFYWIVLRYIEQNPVRAGLVTAPEDYPSSSARSHVVGVQDYVLQDQPYARPYFDDWRAWLAVGLPPAQLDALRERTTTGRPLGSSEFVSGIELSLGRRLEPRPQGRHRAENR